MLLLSARLYSGKRLCIPLWRVFSSISLPLRAFIAQSCYCHTKWNTLELCKLNKIRRTHAVVNVVIRVMCSRIKASIVDFLGKKTICAKRWMPQRQLNLLVCHLQWQGRLCGFQIGPHGSWASGKTSTWLRYELGTMTSLSWSILIVQFIKQLQRYWMKESDRHLATHQASNMAWMISLYELAKHYSKETRNIWFWFFLNPSQAAKFFIIIIIIN